MPHGFGQVVKGAQTVASYAADEAYKMTGYAYHSGMEVVKKFHKSQIDSINASRLEVANPLTTLPGNNKFDMMTNSYVRRADISKYNIRENNGFLKRQYNIGKHYASDQFKGFGLGAILSGGMYGLSAYASDNSDNDAGDRMSNVFKHAVAGSVDLGSDLAITGVSTMLAMTGPYGAIAGGVLSAGNLVAGLMGMDAGSLAMSAMNYADEQYDTAKHGPKFNMTQNTSMMMQRQIQNLHASGSNLGEMMHN